MIECPKCKGKGKIFESYTDKRNLFVETKYRKCNFCKGEGKIKIGDLPNNTQLKLGVL